MTTLNSPPTLLIHSLTECDNSYRVQYTSDGCDVELTLKKSALCQFIVDTNMNFREQYNGFDQDMEQWYIDPKDVLENETQLVVERFLEEGV